MHAHMSQTHTHTHKHTHTPTIHRLKFFFALTSVWFMHAHIQQTHTNTNTRTHQRSTVLGSSLRLRACGRGCPTSSTWSTFVRSSPCFPLGCSPSCAVASPLLLQEGALNPQSTPPPPPPPPPRPVNPKVWCLYAVWGWFLLAFMRKPLKVPPLRDMDSKVWCLCAVWGVGCVVWDWFV